MDEKITEQTIESKAEPKRKKLDASALLNIVAYPASGAAGLYAGKVFTEQKLFERLRDIVFKDQLKTHHENIGKQWNIDGELGPSSKPNPNAWSSIIDTRGDFKAIRDREYASRGLSSTLRKFRALSVYPKNEVVLAGLTAAGVTLGSLLLIANSKNVFNDIFGKEDDEKGNGNGKGIFR